MSAQFNSLIVVSRIRNTLVDLYYNYYCIYVVLFFERYKQYIIQRRNNDNMLPSLYNRLKNYTYIQSVSGNRTRNWIACETHVSWKWKRRFLSPASFSGGWDEGEVSYPCSFRLIVILRGEDSHSRYRKHKTAPAVRWKFNNDRSIVDERVLIAGVWKTYRQSGHGIVFLMALRNIHYCTSITKHMTVHLCQLKCSKYAHCQRILRVQKESCYFLYENGIRINGIFF